MAVFLMCLFFWQLMNWDWEEEEEPVANETGVNSEAYFSEYIRRETDGCLWTNHILFRLKVHYVAA